MHLEDFVGMKYIMLILLMVAYNYSNILRLGDLIWNDALLFLQITSEGEYFLYNKVIYYKNEILQVKSIQFFFIDS